MDDQQKLESIEFRAEIFQCTSDSAEDQESDLLMHLIDCA